MKSEKYKLRFKIEKVTCIFHFSFYNYIIYLMIPNSVNIPLRISTERSTCSFVWVAIRAYLTKVSDGAQAGGTTGLMNTPRSNAIAVTASWLHPKEP